MRSARSAACNSASPLQSTANFSPATRARGVSGHVAMRVVDTFEMVEVEDDQRDRLWLAAGGEDCPLQRFFEVSLVETTRQGVEARQALDLFVVGALDVAAGDVLEQGLADLQPVA